MIEGSGSIPLTSGGPKTCGSGGSGSATLLVKIVPYPHVWQTHGRSLVWTRRWISSWDFDTKLWSQKSHALHKTKEWLHVPYYIVPYSTSDCKNNKLFKTESSLYKSSFFLNFLAFTCNWQIQIRTKNTTTSQNIYWLLVHIRQNEYIYNRSM